MAFFFADSAKRLLSVAADFVKRRIYLASKEGVQECSTVVADALQRPGQAAPPSDTKAADVLQGLEVSFAVVLVVGVAMRKGKRFRFDDRPGSLGSCKTKACAALE